MGSDNAEQQFKRAMNNPVSEIQSEIKPFTTKVDSHILDSLDAFATEIGTSRNSLVVNLLNEYLPTAIYQYFLGHYSFMDSEGIQITQEQYILDCLSKMVDRSDLTDISKTFLERGVVDQVFGPGSYDQAQENQK
jgi:hypothetical protein